MSDKTIKIAEMLDMLPSNEQDLAYEFVKRMVLAWDPDYTKTTKAEAEQIASAEQSEFINDADIDWNNLSDFA